MQHKFQKHMPSFLGNWGECDNNICNSNDQYLEEDNKLALEIDDLIKQHRDNDKINNNVGTTLQGSGTLDDCQCINILKCVRTNDLVDKMKLLSKNHPERSTSISYIQSLICDNKNQGVRCCGRNTDFTLTTTPSTINQVSADEKVCIVKEYSIYYLLGIKI